jgi:hypothetical protein
MYCWGMGDTLDYSYDIYPGRTIGVWHIVDQPPIRVADRHHSCTSDDGTHDRYLCHQVRLTTCVESAVLSGGRLCIACAHIHDMRTETDTMGWSVAADDRFCIVLHDAPDACLRIRRDPMEQAKAMAVRWSISTMARVMRTRGVDPDTVAKTINDTVAMAIDAFRPVSATGPNTDDERRHQPPDASRR